VSADLHGNTLRNTSVARGFGTDASAGLAQGFSRASTRDDFPRRVGLYPYRQHKGRKLVLGDRTEALVYILAHELRHIHQQHGYAVHSVFSVGRVKNSRGRFSKVDTEAFAIHKLRAWRRGTFRGQSAT
jgi:hypothetical protein